VSSFRAAAADIGLGKAGAINLLLSFVQSLPCDGGGNYSGDPVTWSFPAETLKAMHGNAADKALLFGSLCEASGWNSILLFRTTGGGTFSEMWPCVGVECAVPGAEYYDVNGREFYCCETYAPGYVLGQFASWNHRAYIADI
jgi:hypothetical protein